MMDNSNAQIENKVEEPRQQALQINVKMQQNTHTGQPIYANITSVQSGQRIVIVDFGFVDPQLVATLNRMARFGEKTPDTIDAIMSCRMALSIEAANQLAQQLNQLFYSKPESKTQTEHQNTANSENIPFNTSTHEEKDIPKEAQKGFKFPWSS